jgi:hypothetical protein
VIVRKLEYYREGGSPKHARDIRNMLEHSSELIVREELEAKFSQLGLLTAWEQVSSIG